MSAITLNIIKMVDMLPESEQRFAEEFIKRLVLAWDPDFTKLTEAERARLEEAAQIDAAEKSGYILDENIDWDNLSKYAE